MLALAQTSQNEKAITNDLSDLFSEYETDKVAINELGNHLKNFEGPFQYFVTGNGLHSSYTRHLNTSKALKALDSDFWRRAIERTDMMDYMSADQRDEWHSMLREFKAPDFTKENLFATLDNFISTRGDLLARKVDGIFRSLSGTHVTNNPMAFSKKMIIDRALDSLGFPNYHTCNLIDDLRMIIAKHLGRDTKSFRTSTSTTFRMTDFGKEVLVDGGALTIKIYKVGTVHLQVHPEIAIYLNEVLAALYPSVIAEKKGRSKKSDRTYEKPLQRNWINDSLMAELVKFTERGHRGKMFTSSDEAKDILNYLGAIESDGYFYLPDESVEGLQEIVRMGCYPDKKSHQYYPTKSALAKMAVGMFSSFERWEKCLEPSAGQGGLADHLPQKQTTCVEIDPVNSAILKEKGYVVSQGDFLTMKFESKFNKILMNPPFSEGRALLHVKKAMSLLDDSGELVAILPASMANSLKISDGCVEWSDVIQGQFDDTGVSVVILKYTK